MKDQSTLSLEMWRDLVAGLAQPGGPVGIVVRPDLYSRVLHEFIRTGTLNPAAQFVYYDHEQQEECLLFDDRILLIAYLRRKEQPAAWLDAVLRLERKEPETKRQREYSRMIGEDI